MTVGRLLKVLGGLVPIFAFAGMCAAQTPAPYYEGKSIRILVGYAPGGSADVDPRVMARHTGPFVAGPGNAYDGYARLLAQHLGRHIPGTPSVIVQNMPGAGGLRATAFLAQGAAPDGLTLAMPTPQNITEPLLDPRSASYDPRRFGWIGSMNRDVATCAFWNPEIRSVDDLRERTVILGGTGPAAASTLEARVLQRLLGFKFEIVLGYPGLLDIRHPAERGEVDGFCGLLVSSIGPSAQADLAAGKFRILLQTGLQARRELGPAAALAMDLAPDAESREILALTLGRWELGKALAAPPGAPDDRLATLRQAFTATLDSPAFQQSAAQGGFEINPLDADEAARLIGRFYALPNSTIARARALLKPEE